jgi:predicted RNA binding protein YcfA (HicA-like mRNA interferase family)
MARLPVISGKYLVKLLEKHGFEIINKTPIFL